MLTCLNNALLQYFSSVLQTRPPAMHKHTLGHQATKRNTDTCKKTCKKTCHCLPLFSERATTKWEAAAHKYQYSDLASSAIRDSHNTVLAKLQGITGPLLKYVYMSCFVHKQKLALFTLHSEPTRALKSVNMSAYQQKTAPAMPLS